MCQVPRARGPTVAVLASTRTYQPRYHGLARDGPTPGYHLTYTFSTFSRPSSSFSFFCRILVQFLIFTVRFHALFCQYKWRVIGEDWGR